MRTQEEILAQCEARYRELERLWGRCAGAAERVAKIIWH